MNFCVEVLTVIDKTNVIKRHEAKSFADALTLAQSMAVQMFPEDPMSARVFRAGQYEYSNMNDCGGLVTIKPLAFKTEEMKVIDDFVVLCDNRPPREPA
jgi:hypothetical protein